MLKELKIGAYVNTIPKKYCPENVCHYRPISLCNVSYKIISKVLTNRLKRVTPNIWRGFIQSGGIHNNILVAHKILNSFSKRRIIEDVKTIKLDMKKPYDILEQKLI